MSSHVPDFSPLIINSILFVTNLAGFIYCLCTDYYWFHLLYICSYFVTTILSLVYCVAENNELERVKALLFFTSLGGMLPISLLIIISVILFFIVLKICAELIH